MLDIEMLQIVTDNFTQETREKNFKKIEIEGYIL